MCQSCRGVKVIGYETWNGLVYENHFGVCPFCEDEE